MSGFNLCLDLISRLFSNRDREIFILRQQILILKRQLGRKTITVSSERGAMLLFGQALAAHLKKTTILIVQPETFLSWHRKIVRKSWTYPRCPKPGRPPKAKVIRDLILRLAKENPRWGYGKIQGELKKLGINISQATISRILARNGFPGKSWRQKLRWRNFLGQYKDFIWSCDFFTNQKKAIPRWLVERLLSGCRLIPPPEIKLSNNRDYCA